MWWATALGLVVPGRFCLEGLPRIPKQALGDVLNAIRDRPRPLRNLTNLRMGSRWKVPGYTSPTMGESETTPPSQTPAGSRRFIVLVAIATALVVTAALVGFGWWKDTQPGVNGLANRVVDSMNESLSSDQQFHTVGLHVKWITVLHAAGNMFEGQATVATHTGTDHQVSVHIVYDGDTMLWRTDPGAFAFAVQEQLQGT